MCIICALVTRGVNRSKSSFVGFWSAQAHRLLLFQDFGQYAFVYVRAASDCISRVLLLPLLFPFVLFKNVATLEYNRYDEVVNMGYEHAMSALRARTVRRPPELDADGEEENS